MSTPTEVTVTMPWDEYCAVCDLLQLLVVVGIQLYMRGNAQPNKEKLSRAFDRMCTAGLTQHGG
jgi:hypothetical protein